MDSEHGFTLLEFMVVAMLVIMVLGFTVSQFGIANSRRSTTQAVADLKTIINHTRAQYDLQRGFTGIDEIQVATAADFPAHLCKNGDCTQGIYSSAFGDVNYIGPYSRGFFINFTNISNQMCEEIGTKMIMSVEHISVGAMGSIGALIVNRSDVLASSATKPARDWFLTTGTGLCAAITPTSVIYFYVDL